MAQSILIFDFGENEEVAQQARHKFESWKQAFRLGDKVMLKFERVAKESAGNEAGSGEKSAGKKGPKSRSPKGQGETGNSELRILIRLNFSDHEKLSHQRWLDRIPSEDPFKTAKPKIVRQADADFATVSERFDSLD